MVDAEVVARVVEAERERFGVPGVAVAVVVGDAPPLLAGFGRRDLARDLPVTPDTAFPIASDSKAFTAAVLCRLEEAGRIDLDAPVRDTVPWFALHDPAASALVSTVDLLAHRTGVPRHDLVWASADDRVSLEDCARALAHLPAVAGFRTRWLYSNLATNAAGYVTEQVAGAPWAAVVRDLLLDPLGMAGTSADAVSASAGDFAVGYGVGRDGDLAPQVVPTDRRLGPAGGLVSTARDLARWLRARLGREPGVLTAAVLERLHAPAIVQPARMPAPERQPMGYALGCTLESYRGERVVHHGGSLPGWTSEVLLAPERGIGIAVLGNRADALLPEAVALDLLDHALGRDVIGWGARRHAQITALHAGVGAAAARRTAEAPGRPPTLPAAEVAGTYAHPAYGPIELLDRDGALGIDLRGFGDRVALHHLDRDAYEVRFDVGVRVPLVVRADGWGDVTEVEARFEGSADPVRFARVAPPPDPADLADLPSTWRAGAMAVEVRRRGDALSAVVLGEHLPLTPIAAGRLRAPGLRLEVERSPDGTAEVLHVDPLGPFTRDA